MKLLGWLISVLLMANVAHAQTLRQVDSATYRITADSAKSLTLRLTWFDSNTLSDTLSYQLAWYDVDSVTSRLVKRTMAVFRTRQQTLTVTKPGPFTSAPYEACVTASYPAKAAMATCTPLSYLNFDLLGRLTPVYPALQRGKVTGGIVYSYSRLGDSNAIILRYNVEVAKTPDTSIEAPTTTVCSMFVTRKLTVYQRTSDLENLDCIAAFHDFFGFYRWKHAADSSVQAVVDTLPLAVNQCTIATQDGYIQRALTCP